jgi:hypothetical protein
MIGAYEMSRLSFIFLDDFCASSCLFVVKNINLQYCSMSQRADEKEHKRATSRAQLCISLLAGPRTSLLVLIDDYAIRPTTSRHVHLAVAYT